MPRFNKYIINTAITALFILLPLTIFGQNVSVTMEGPSSVSISEQFQLNITINSSPSSFSPPGLSDFTVLMGPSTSSSSSVQIINGRMSQSSEYTYSYVLQPKKNGKFSISPASFVVNGKKYSSNSLSIEVTGNAASKSQSAQNSSNEKVDESGDVFVRVLLDKTSIFQGEFIVASVKLYSKVNISSINRLDFPSFDGFYKQDIETPPLRRLEKENVNGQIYGTGIIQKFILIPQKTGQLTIAPCTMDCAVEVQVRNNSFFDDFFSNSVQNVLKKIQSKPVRVNVKPLPNRPPSFTGGVGKFNFNASYDKSKVKQNDPVILKITVSGAGNIKLIEAPKISFPNGIETSEPSTTNKTNDKDGGISGTRQFEYLLIPRAPGKVVFPPIEFSFFDPIAGQFKTLTSPSTTLDVEPGSSSLSMTSSNGSAKEDVKFLGKDIQYIKLDNFDLKRSGDSFFGNLIFYLLYIIPLLIFVTILLLRRNYIKQNANSVLTRNRKAEKYATKRLKKAKEYLASAQKEKFYEEVLKAIWGYLSDKLNIPVSELSRENAQNQLTQAGIKSDALNRLLSIIDRCEYAQYAPVSHENSMEADYKESVTIITQIQENIR
jgi:hypothetical protein